MPKKPTGSGVQIIVSVYVDKKIPATKLQRNANILSHINFILVGYSILITWLYMRESDSGLTLNLQLIVLNIKDRSKNTTNAATI